MVDKTTQSRDVLPHVTKETPRPVRIAESILKEQEETEGVIDFTMEIDEEEQPHEIRKDEKPYIIRIRYNDICTLDIQIYKKGETIKEPGLKYVHTKEDGWKLIKIEQHSKFDIEGKKDSLKHHAVDISEDYTNDVADYIYDVYNDSEPSKLEKFPCSPHKKLR
jgi:hypothetical protein